MPAAPTRTPGAVPVLALLGLLAAATATLELTAHPLADTLVPACLALGSGATAVVARGAAAGLPGRSGRPWWALALAMALLASPTPGKITLSAPFMVSASSVTFPWIPNRSNAAITD